MGAGADRSWVDREGAVSARRKAGETREGRQFAGANPVEDDLVRATGGSPDQWRAAMVAAGPHARARTVGGLQQAGGNARVQRMVQRAVPEQGVVNKPEGPGGTSTGGASTSVSRQVQRYKGDFFDNPTLDAASSLAWDIGGMIPFVGTAVNAAALGIDLGKAGIDSAMGDAAARDKHLRAAGADAVGMIPGVGSLTGLLSASTDLAAVMGRAGGRTPEQAPTSGDIVEKYLTTLPEAPPASPNQGAEGSSGVNPEEQQPPM